MLSKTPAANSLREPQSTGPNRYKSDSDPNDQVSAFAPIISATFAPPRSVAELVITVSLWLGRSVIIVGLWYEGTTPTATQLVRLSKKFICNVAKIGTAIAVILRICLMSAVLTAIEMFCCLGDVCVPVMEGLARIRATAKSSASALYI